MCTGDFFGSDAVGHSANPRPEVGSRLHKLYTRHFLFADRLHDFAPSPLGHGSIPALGRLQTEHTSPRVYAPRWGANRLWRPGPPATEVTLGLSI